MRQMSKPYTPSDTFVLVLIPTILGALCLSILRDITIPACVPRSKLGYERSRRIGYGRVSGSQWAPSGPTGSPVRLFWRVFRVLPTLGRAAGRAESFWRRGRRGGRINYLWISALYRDCHTTHVIQAKGMIQFQHCTHISTSRWSQKQSPSPNFKRILKNRQSELKLHLFCLKVSDVCTMYVQLASSCSWLFVTVQMSPSLSLSLWVCLPKPLHSHCALATPFVVAPQSHNVYLAFSSNLIKPKVPL